MRHLFDHISSEMGNIWKILVRFFLGGKLRKSFFGLILVELG